MPSWGVCLLKRNEGGVRDRVDVVFDSARFVFVSSLRWEGGRQLRSSLCTLCLFVLLMF